MGYVPKIYTTRDMRYFELPYVTAEGGSRLRETLRFAQRRSQQPHFTFMDWDDHLNRGCNDCIMLRIMFCSTVDKFRY